MEEDKLLYQVKTLGALIGRLFICSDINDKVVPPTPTQMQIVEYILEHPNENIYQKDLEDILNLRRATVSGVLQTMEKNHLIERVIDTEDSRVKKIILNEDAKKLFESYEKRIEEIESVVIKDLTEEELLQFLSVIKKMQNNLKLVVNKERK